MIKLILCHAPISDDFLVFAHRFNATDVIPAQAGIQTIQLDPRLRGGDNEGVLDDNGGFVGQRNPPKSFELGIYHE